MENNLDVPPSYEDVIEEESRVKKTEKLHGYYRKSFTVLNALCSGLIIFGFLIIRYSGIVSMHMLNVTIYCNDPFFNVTPIPKHDNSYSFFLVFFVLVIILAVGIIRFNMESLTFDILVKKLVLEIWAFTTHLFFLFVAIELIKLAIGMPCPYYFGNSELKGYYCEPRNSTISMTRTLQLLDASYRSSFPSGRAAVCAFCITYLYLYVDHCDRLIGMHTAQQGVVIVLGTYTSHLMMEYLEKGETHKVDLVFALIIGFLHALVAIRNTFGTIVYQRTHVSLVSFSKFYSTNSNAASELYELQPLRHNRNNATASTNNTPWNNSNPSTSGWTNNNESRSFVRNIPENVNTISEQVVPNIPYNG